MIKRETAGYYMDFYSALLTPKQREVLSLYVQEDLTLSEIAEDANVTRQGVHDVLRRALDKLEFYERHLGMVAQYHRQREMAFALRNTLSTESLRPESRQALEAFLKEWEE